MSKLQNCFTYCKIDSSGLLGQKRDLSETLLMAARMSASKNMMAVRESKFTLSAAKAPLPNYDALRDSNLRQYFESRTVQKFLQSAGWIDKSGKIIDLDRFRCCYI